MGNLWSYFLKSQSQITCVALINRKWLMWYTSVINHSCGTYWTDPHNFFLMGYNVDIYAFSYSDWSKENELPSFLCSYWVYLASVWLQCLWYIEQKFKFCASLSPVKTCFIVWCTVPQWSNFWHFVMFLSKTYVTMVFLLGFNPMCMINIR